jgi:hypothetical protein
MATAAQINANRLNSQKSTGPRTAEGKATSSQNAFKSGIDAHSQICPGDNPAELLQLQSDYFAQFNPRTAEERFHVDSLIRNEWTLRRLFRTEAQMFEAVANQDSTSKATPLGSAFLDHTPAFMRLQRRITLCEKSHQASLAALRQIQQDRQNPAATADPFAALFNHPDATPQPPDFPTPSDEIGFVPKDSKSENLALRL